MPTDRPKAQRTPLPSPVGQALALLDTALAQMVDLGKRIDNSAYQLNIVRESLSLYSPGDSKTREIDTVKDAIRRLKNILDGFQSIDIAQQTDVIARHVARGVAGLYAFHQAASAKRLSKKTEHKPVPQHIIERRTSPRAAVEAEIGFQSDNNFFTGLSEDISTGGLFLATFDIHPIDSLLNVNFTLPGGHFISANGIVRWIREYNELTPEVSPGMGIQFDELSINDRDAIDAFINQRPTMFFDES